MLPKSDIKYQEIIVIGGFSGSGKTKILRELGKNGHQILDLERLASHSGSSFGEIPTKRQPSNQEFTIKLLKKWNSFNFLKPVWVEYKTYYIGKVQIPKEIFQKTHSGTLILLKCNKKLRISNIVNQYSVLGEEKLLDATIKIKNKLKKDNYSKVLWGIKNNRYEIAVNILLDYYDKAYIHSLKLENYKKIVTINIIQNDASSNCKLLLRNYSQFG